MLMTSNVLGLGCAALLALVIGHTAAATDAPDPWYRGYAIVSEPTIRPDLQQVVYLHVQGRTVLEGLIQILEGTGYRLAHEAAADPEIGRLYEQPYPENQRDLGPRALGEVLERLAGPAWRLVEDPVNRLISFEVQPAYRAGATISLRPTGPEAFVSDWSRGGQR